LEAFSELICCVLCDTGGVAVLPTSLTGIKSEVIVLSARYQGRDSRAHRRRLRRFRLTGGEN